MTRAVLAVCMALALPGAARQEPFVGWRFEVALDPAREYEPEAGDPSGRGPRPVAITVFYPATPNDAARTSYDELARLGAYDRFRRPPDTASADAAAAAFQGSGPASSSRTTRSTRDARPLSGRHPLILFVHSTPLGMAAMSEDLAAHGFVVAGVISRGAERGAYRLSVPDVQAMAADLRFAIDRLRSLSFVDPSRLGVIGMSNGAFGAVALANQVRLDAIVSLDGTVGERAAARILPEVSSATTPPRAPPLLHLYGPDNSYLDFSALRTWGAECLTVRVPEVSHADFLTFALLRPVDPAAMPRRERVVEKFSSLVRLSRQFLESKLRSSAGVELDAADRALGLTAAPCRAE